MKIVSEVSLRDFKFWSGAKDTAAELTNDQLDLLEKKLEEEYPEGMTDKEINHFFWFNRDVIRQWLELNSYPKWCVFKSKLGNNRVVGVADEWAENKLQRMIDKYDVKAEWYKQDGAPSFDDVTGCNLSAEYSDDFEEWLWEEDNGMKYLLWLPENWAVDFENGEFTGDDEEERAYNKFLKDYEYELSNTSDYFYLWDTDNIEFRTNPDYGEAGDCCTLRIYDQYKQKR